jgi:phospholipid N-methyltransferase
VRKLTGRPTFNAIVSGLPFNNFEACEVRAFLEHYRKMLKPLGTLSFFEYMGVRRVQTRLALAPAPRRKRLREVGKVVQEFVREHELRRDIVVINIPPARVFHLRFDRDSAKADA